MDGAFIYLIGFAGCGKLTIAQAIRARYDCILVDNHSGNNVVFSLIDPDGHFREPGGGVQRTKLHRVRPGLKRTFR